MAMNKPQGKHTPRGHRFSTVIETTDDQPQKKFSSENYKLSFRFVTFRKPSSL